MIKQVIEMLIGNIKTNALNFIVLGFLFVLICLGVLGLLLEVFNKHQTTREVLIISKENITDEHFLGYFSLFVLFAITFDLSRISMFVVFVLILIMIGVVYVKNKLFYINPFLNILGFNFYSITYQEKGELENKTHIFSKSEIIPGNKYKVKIKDENFSFIA